MIIVLIIISNEQSLSYYLHLSIPSREIQDINGFFSSANGSCHSLMNVFLLFLQCFQNFTKVWTFPPFFVMFDLKDTAVFIYFPCEGN